jgi:hypothetical protein
MAVEDLIDPCPYLRSVEVRHRLLLAVGR